MSMRTMVAVLTVLTVGCGTEPAKAPSEITIVVDAAFQSDAALMARVRSAAALWSSVGATVNVATSGEGIPLRLVPAAQWNHLASVYGSQGSDGIEMQQEGLTSLLPGEQVLALAHEMGHALGLWHVDDQHAVMYRYVNHPLAAEGLTQADAAEYFSVHP